LRDWRRIKVKYVLIASSAILLICLAEPGKKNFLYNLTESIPKGVYFLHRNAPVIRNSLIAFNLPDELEKFAIQRQYIPSGVPFMKRVLGKAGDTVCVAPDGNVDLNGEVIGLHYPLDRDGRKMPAWSGCHSLSQDEYFVFGDHPRSFDSRYFGAVKRTDILGTLTRVI